jgi:DNA-binding transcriptional ArsR family regulator
MQLSETNSNEVELTSSEPKNLVKEEILGLKFVEKGKASISINNDDKFELIMKALSSKTRRDILREIQNHSEGLDVSELATLLNSPIKKNSSMTEANISAQIKKLEEAGLIYCDYCSGQHGVRKISKLNLTELLLRFI